MASGTTITVVYDHLPEIERRLEAAVRAVVSKACADTEAIAKVEAPVDTGNLKNSITHEVSGAGGHTEGIVYTDVEYAPYQEYGTVFQPGKPFMTPAFERVKPQVLEALAHIEAHL